MEEAIENTPDADEAPETGAGESLNEVEQEQAVQEDGA
jgi:hypothetical protein